MSRNRWRYHLEDLGFGGARILNGFERMEGECVE
jgi:hypothetical protein